MVIFKFIDDKDVFQKFYSKKLAQRLVAQSSASDDSESSMISKLNVACGFDYTNKLSRMFTGESSSDVGLRLEFRSRWTRRRNADASLDVGVSKDLTQRFTDKDRQQGHDDGSE